MQQQILQRLPNSNLAAQIRKATNKPQLAEESPVVEPELFPKKRRDDYQPQEGLDDRFRPSLDRESKSFCLIINRKTFMSTHAFKGNKNMDFFLQFRLWWLY